MCIYVYTCIYIYTLYVYTYLHIYIYTYYLKQSGLPVDQWGKMASDRNKWRKLIHESIESCSTALTNV